MKKIKTWYLNSVLYRYIVSAVLHPKNFIFCLKFPFYKSRNAWTDKFLGYAFTWYDLIERGWQIAFGKQLSIDLKKALKNDKLLYRFRFIEIKEKWGSLCLYNNSTGRHSEFIINKYELLSMCYCINCGKPVRYVTRGWVSYICEECAKKELSKEALSEYRVRPRDIPQWSNIDQKTGKFKSIDFKKIYNVDIKELWGLKK